ncbi:hypothetical protein PM082_017380 [Marasmius tenuissimus]|nr:hypothetical protein PM082_017380 [Marasmius tenuissimus]
MPFVAYRKEATLVSLRAQLSDAFGQAYGSALDRHHQPTNSKVKHLPWTFADVYLSSLPQQPKMRMRM